MSAGRWVFNFVVGERRKTQRGGTPIIQVTSRGAAVLFLGSFLFVLVSPARRGFCLAYMIPSCWRLAWWML